MRHFLALGDLPGKDIVHLLDEAVRLRKARQQGKDTPLLHGRLIGLIFEKPSLRTRVSFEAAVAHLGGKSLFMSGSEVGLGVRESIADIARTISQYVDGVVLRTFQHATVQEFAAHASCPVINGLSDYSHPCQALGDLLTIRDTFGDLSGRTVVFVGDGNNVARSLAVGCGKLGVRFILAAPEGYGFDQRFLDAFQKQAPEGRIEELSDPRLAVQKVDIVYTDVWTSMGQETERDRRLRAFAGYQLNGALLQQAPPHARVMHCLPAHRGEEITDEVLDGPRSIVFVQAANRLHGQKALLAWLLGKNNLEPPVKKATAKAPRRARAH